MEQKNKKFFPQEAKPSAPKAAPKSGRSGFQARKVPDFHHATPAGPCTNLRDLFDNYVDTNYKKMPDDRRKALWQKVAMDMLSEPFGRIGEIIESHLSK